MTEDALLLNQFVTRGDEEAFRALVERHFDLVYSVALRQLNGDSHLAQDVAQFVFTDLARKAARLSHREVLSGWLYEAARLTAGKTVRTEQRRRAREKAAHTMQESSTEASPDWEQLRPALDGAMGQLSVKDRNAVLLRFFEGQNFRKVGEALGISEDAAQKRVSRALENLRSVLGRRGISLPASALALMLATSTVQSAPVGAAISVASGSLAGIATAGKFGLMQWIMSTLARPKVALIGIAAGGLLLGGAMVTRSAWHPARGADFVTVDLSSHYTSELDKVWVPGFEAGNNLASLPHGRHEFEHVPFDVGGIIQLQGRLWQSKGYTFAERVEGLPAESRVQRLHLLHANSAFADTPGTVVASLVLHYSDGSEAQLPIRQNQQILDWWQWPKGAQKPGDPNTHVAWRGSNPATAKRGFNVRLCKTVFQNPNPEKEIKSIDYVSAMAGSAPFMVALTLER
jgi:RNA polymerase sigma factor (sigma-70 family)